jgi:antitoxin component YwqK of YwqJK toxin-antitoxin module
MVFIELPTYGNELGVGVFNAKDKCEAHVFLPPYMPFASDSSYKSRKYSVYAPVNDYAVDQTLLVKTDPSSRFVDVEFFYSLYWSCDDTNRDVSVYGVMKAEYELVDGHIHGMFRLWTQTNTLIVDATYEHGKLHGECKCWWIDFHNELRMVSTYDNGEVVKGTTKLHYPSGGMYSDGTRLYHPNGNVMRDGNREYHLNGKLKRDGKLEYHKNGKLAADSSVADVLKTWHPNGKPKEHTQRGDAFASQKWHPNGKLAYEFTSATCDDMPIGIHKRYHRKTGAPSEVTRYSGGRKHGIWAKWYDNGNKRFERNYRADKKHGVHKEWREDGALWSSTVIRCAKMNHFTKCDECVAYYAK